MMVISQRPSARRRSVPSPLDLLFAMLLLSFIWQQGVSPLKLNITLCVLEVVVPPAAENLHLQTAVILLGDGSDGIGIEGQGIVIEVSILSAHTLVHPGEQFVLGNDHSLADGDGGKVL